MPLLIVTLAIMAAPGPDLPASHLLRVDHALQLARADIGGMQPAADQAAALLAAGGTLYAAGQPSLVSELCGRAGGMMMFNRLSKGVPGKGDVVVYALQEGEAVRAAVADSGALLVVLGPKESPAGGFAFPCHAEEAGISSTLANAIPGWLFTGELIAALTRIGKMPVIYASIGTYQGFPRINKFKGISFHEKHGVAKIPAGQIGQCYVDAVSGFLRRVEAEERADLLRAASWSADAKKQGRRLIMYSMGHAWKINYHTVRSMIQSEKRLVQILEGGSGE